MRKKKWCVLLCVLAQVWITLTIPVSAQEQNKAVAEDGTKVVRVGYVESENYDAFARNLAGIALGLVGRDVISGVSVSPDATDARAVWTAMAGGDSSRIRFVENVFFTMKTMEEEDFAQFINRDDIDLLIVMGTVAGVYVAEHETKNDFMVFAAANPILSRIVKNETERFKENAYAYIDPSRFRRQLDVAYNIFGFTKLGVVYEDSSAAYAYSGIEQAELSAEAHGFTIARQHVKEATGEEDRDRYYEELKAAYSQLIGEGIDALYITTATTEDDMLPWLLEDIYAAEIPTISQVGEGQVRNGVVLGVTLDDPMDQGRFIADVMEQYLDGVPVGRLPQVYEIVPKVFFNYDAAIRSGIRLPFKTLLSMDEIFRDELVSAGEKS